MGCGRYVHRYTGILTKSTTCDDCGKVLLEPETLNTSGDTYSATNVHEYNPNALRFNNGKVDYTLIPTIALEAEARMWMHGEQKYGRDNWRKFWGDSTPNVVLASALRHLIAMQRGEVIDPESGLPHAAAVRCNMAMLLEWQKNVK